jgi:hypothetical protein
LNNQNKVDPNIVSPLESKRKFNDEVKQNKAIEKNKNEDQFLKILNQDSVELNESTDSENFIRLMNKTYSESGNFTNNFSSKADYFINTFYYAKDKNLMKGNKKITIKEEGIAQKKLSVKLPFEGDLFKKDEKVLKLSNPIAYNLTKRQEELDLKYLKRKLDASNLKSKNLYGHI